MSLSSRPARRSRRHNQHLVESLESRRLLSLMIDMQVTGFDPTSTVHDSSITNAHTITSPQVGAVYDVAIYAVIQGTGTNGSALVNGQNNDNLDLIYGSLIASELRSSGYFGAVAGTFSIPTLEPYFINSTYKSGPGMTYTDSVGNVNVGSTDATADPSLFIHPVQNMAESLPPSTLIGQGSAGAGNETEVATTTFTVTSIASGPPTTLEFNLRPPDPTDSILQAFWYEDGTVKDTLDGDTVLAPMGITVTEPDTIPPTASATLSPILGSTTDYQFTVNYADNQDLNQSDFSSTNILVTGPNGYSQLATYVPPAVDADASANAQYDPYNVTYQITPPDSTTGWSIADNGQYTFTLEPNQIADNSGNYAASAVLGGGPLDVEFTGAVSISPATASIGENSTAPDVFTVTRTDAIGNNFANAMTVSYSVMGVTGATQTGAVAGTNYTALSGSVTIPAGQASATINVQPIDDQLVDYDSGLSLAIGYGSTYVLGTNTKAALTIQNTDTVAASISDVAVGRTASDQTLTFPVTLSAPAAVTTYIDYSTANGTAIAGTDYTAASGQLIFDAGSTTPETPLTVTVLASNAHGDLTFGVNLTVDSQSTEQLTLAQASATATIADVVAAALSPLTTTVSPGLKSTTAEYTVTLANASTQMLTVNYATTDGSAVAGTDYTATTGSLTFQPGQTSATIDVPISAVVRSNSGKSFTLTISSGSSLVTVDSSVATATVSFLQPNFASPNTGELAIDPKKGATYIDAAGNQVRVKVSNVSAGTFVGNIIFPGGGPTTGLDAVGIVLDGTTAKSVLTITTKSTTLDFIDVNGTLKGISAKGVSLAQSSASSMTPYLTTTGAVSTLTLGNLSTATVTTSGEKTFTAGGLTGSTLNIGGAVTAKMKFGNIQDSEITDSASVSTFTASQWINTDSTADLLSVNGLKTLNVKGDFEASFSAGVVGTVAIKGAWSNSVFVATSFKKVTVGTAANSTLAASTSPNDMFPPTVAELAAGGQITSFLVKSKAANAFSATIIEAQYIGTLVLGNVDATNTGNLFGVATESIKSLTGSDSSGKFSKKNISNAQPGAAESDQDFSVELVS